MTGRDAPPRWARLLLRLILPEGLTRDSVLGDLDEDFDGHRRRTSLPAARWRYGRQALAVALRYGLFRLASSARRQPGDDPMIPSLVHDLGQAFRSLLRAPGFALLAALTLGAGVGATSAIFSVVDAVLLRPLPYPDADALVVLRYADDGREMDNHSEPEYLDYERDLATLSHVAGYQGASAGLGSGDEPRRITGAQVTASFFDVLGVEPERGRAFSAEEDLPGGPPVVLLSHGLWTEAFGGDPSVVGTTILLNDEPHTVLGVMPRSFAFPGDDTRYWVPLALDRADPWDRNNHYLSVVGRLAAGVGIDALQGELDALSARSGQRWPDMYSEQLSFKAYTLRDRVVGDVRPALLLLFAAVVGVLLIASVNAAALFLARGEQRRGEMAVRTAMGAGRGRVAAQLVAESLMVAALAAAAGVALAYAGVAGLRSLAPDALPRVDEVAVNGRVLAFGVAVSLLTGLVFGLAPAFQALRSDVRDVLATGAWGGIGSRRAGRFRRGLVVVQLALATMLALGAGLLTRSFQALRHVELGFDPHGVVTVPLYPTPAAVPQDAPAVDFYQRLEARVAALPGVETVGTGLRLPLATGHDGYSIQVEGKEVDNVGDARVAAMQYVTPGFFQALGIGLRMGRTFTSADRVDAPLVAVVSQNMADLLWPGEDPLGKRLRMFPDGNPWMEVVGVVADVKHNGIRADASTKLYVPHAQGYRSAYYSPNRGFLVVRTAGDPTVLAAPVRAAVREVGPGIPLGAVRAMDDVVSAALARERFTLLLLGAFTLVAVLLAAVGVYGVIARAVASRTREIGLRMAVGADRRAIAGAVMREGLTLAAVGCTVGLVGGLALSHLLRSLLFGVSPADPVSSVAAVAVLALVAIAASVVPAAWASRLDPVRALRSE